jgi:hypothetical protein
MEMDNIKSVWQGIPTYEKDKKELELMIKKNSHPILNSIKKQIVMELFGFTAFLFCYFTMFDGGTKPIATNLLIITAILLQLLYGYKGYLMQSKFRSSTNLNNDLENFASRLKTYRLGAVMARVFFAIALITFFSYDVNFSANKFWALGFIIVVFSVQLWFLYSIWTKRISRLELVLEEFKVGFH